LADFDIEMNNGGLKFDEDGFANGN